MPQDADPHGREPGDGAGPAAERPETAAAGNALVWFTGTLLAFGLFLVLVPGSDPGGRTWLWVGIALTVVGGATSALAVLARVRHLRSR